MTTAYTTLLGYALPVEGELDGTWGDTVNNSITQLVEDSVAGVATQSVASGNWTLSTTGSGAQNQARCAILVPTGSPGVSRNIIAPSSSKAYIVVNQSDAAVVLKGSATTGVTIDAGAKALCAWNGSDFVIIGISQGTGTFTQVDITAQGDLRLQDTTGGQYVALQAPSTVASNVTFTLPGADGTSGQAITTDGSGALGFTTVVTPSGTQTLTNKTLTTPTITNPYLITAREKSTISATAAGGLVNYDAVTQSVLYYTTDASSNFIINIRGDSGTSLDSLMSTGQSLTVTFLATNGSTAYYNTTVQVDAASATVKWQGGSAPTTGSTSSIDVYVYTVIKTASATFTVLASQTAFA